MVLIRRGAAFALALLCMCGLLAGCASSLPDYSAQTHTVRAGETLYAIAWQYGVDHRALGRWNGLSDPNLIFPGQRLLIRPADGPTAPRSPTASSAPVRTSPSSPGAGSAPPAPRPAPAARVVTQPAPDWNWPTRGVIVARFGASDGIDSGIALAGMSGQTVVAAAAGNVVYVGTGLAGYGQLVIVKHNDTYLSAYGHTDRVLVSQGDSVARGQRIASMGLGPRRQARLHFEIRRNGVPVDPLPLLPAQP